MKTIIGFICCLASSYCVLARPGGGGGGIEQNLQFFDVNELSQQAREYKVHESASCPDSVNSCLLEMHQAVNGCLQKWKQQAGPRYEHCANEDPVVKNASRDWQVPSFKWHQAVDRCLAGDDQQAPPSLDALQSLARQSAAMAFYSRKKRDTGLQAPSDEVTACWRDARRIKDQCKRTAIQCTKFAHCFGEGPAPSDATAKRWYDYVKRTREEVKRKSKVHIMHMGHCLRNEPHTSGDHGGGHHGMHHEGH